MMRHLIAAVTLFTVMVVGAQAAVDRRWQPGMCTQVGIERTLYVADVVHERMPPSVNTPQRTEVATCVIETDDRRYHLQAMVAIGSDEFATNVTVGSVVTFAIERRRHISSSVGSNTDCLCARPSERRRREITAFDHGMLASRNDRIPVGTPPCVFQRAARRSPHGMIRALVSNCRKLAYVASPATSSPLRVT